MKNINKNFVAYLLLILLAIVFFSYNCSYNNKVNQLNSLKNEGFKTIYSEKHLAGKAVLKIPPGNSCFPRDKNNITVFKSNSDFNNNNNNESKIERLYLDNKDNGIELHSKGYILVELDVPQKINSILIKGLKNGRVDINNKSNKKNEFTHLFDINTPRKDILFEYDNLNINNLNSNLGGKSAVSGLEDLEISKLKITNIDNLISGPIKLELISHINNKEQRNTAKNKIAKVELFNCEEKIVDNQKVMVNEDNYKNLYIKAKLGRDYLVSGVRFKTNIPKFKIMAKETLGEAKLYEGGVDGVKELDYYFEKYTRQTNEIKIVPFIDNKDMNKKQYFISDIKIFGTKFNSKMINKEEDLIEGFEDSDNIKDIFINDLQNSIEIQKACQALAYQEDINRESHKLNTFKKYNTLLENQRKELEELNKTIEDLKAKRNRQIAQEDMLNLSKHTILRSQELKLLEELENKKRNFEINFNLTKNNDNTENTENNENERNNGASNNNQN